MKHYFLNIPINHDGTDYKEGDVVQMSDNDALFLNMVGIIRPATAEEIAASQAGDDTDSSVAPVTTATETTQTDNADVAPETQTETQTETVTADNTDPATETNTQTETAGGSELDTDTTGQTEAVTTEQTKPYSEWLKAELVAELELRGIDHTEATHNDLRVALLEKDDADKAAQTATETTE